MGSLEAANPVKRAPFLRLSSPSPASNGGGGGSGFRSSLFLRPRSRIARFLLFEKVDYLQWVFTVAAFFLVLVLFQAFLPGSVLERSPDGASVDGAREGIQALFPELGELDFGEGIRFFPSKLIERWERESREESNSSVLVSGRPVRRYELRKPKLALVVPDLSPDAMQLQMVTIAAVLKEIGYDIQVFSFEDGPVHAVWRTLGLPVNLLPMNVTQDINVDWFDYTGVLMSSLDARPLLSCLLQEPFKSIPVIWTIHEKSLALCQNAYVTNGQLQLVNNWKQVFSRATVVVFPTHLMPMMYSSFDADNYWVISGTPSAIWEADKLLSAHSEYNIRSNIGYRAEEFVITIVSSQFLYSGMLLEHSVVLEALFPLLQQFPSLNSSYSLVKVAIISGNVTSSYRSSLQAIAQKLGYPRSTVEHIISDGEATNYLSVSDLVIYGSFLEEQSFPDVLIQAMSLGKLVIAPDLGIITKYVDDRVNAFLFPKEKVGMLNQIIFETISNGKLTPFAQQVASIGKSHARGLMASESIQGYVTLLEKVLQFPSEVSRPKSFDNVPSRLKENWQWQLFEDIAEASAPIRRYSILDRLEEQWNRSKMVSANAYSKLDEAFSPIVWEEERKIALVNAVKRMEEEELKDRTDQPHGTWEEVYRNVKKADRGRNELHERDERELERTGQPLCIYEPFFGEGTWPFLHQTPLYRGIGLSSKGRRPGADDIDASSRLPLLTNAYYRDMLGEYGAFFALANRIDRVHKNSWIGFQSWRASARKAALSKKADKALLEAIQASKHGDALYFWVRMDKDPRNPRQLEFWDFCDAINAGNCRFAVSEAFRRMYGLQHDFSSLPLMPNDGDSWSVMHSWVLPTRSFLEFVMFSRMFVDALDAQMYDEHHQSGHCCLSISKDKQCYSRVLELLVNIWAYHSARHMVYLDTETGAMQEQHNLKDRKGQMWIRWFSYAALKSMDEDLAEEADLDHSSRRWLWPSTGEVFWQGLYERERNMRHQQKERRRQLSKDKIRRIKNRARQKTLGKYVKPPPDEIGDSNNTRTQ